MSVAASAPPAGQAEQPDDEAPSPRRTRRRRLVTVAVVVVFVGLATVAALMEQRTSDRPFAPDNPAPGGAMAVAEILRDQGVDVTEAGSWAELTHEAGPRTTVFVPDAQRLRPGQYDDLVGTGADVAIAGYPWNDEVLQDLPVDAEPGSGQGVTVAECSDPDARAASRIALGGPVLLPRTAADATVCFPASGTTPGAGGYAVWSADQAQVRYLGDHTLLTNERLASHGHAALALRMLGHHETLLWYMPSTVADTSPEPGPQAPLVPPAATWVLWTLLAAAAVLGVGQARSLGPVVAEVMPVVVRAAETTRGRGRLYRRGRARGHAAESLRAGTASRLAHTLGLPRSADRPTLVDAVARATGRDRTDVDNLLYGTAPTDDRGLLTLSAMLDDLEREVHRS
ncbi:DUF4350 domain-containing protein [Georgenia alba]|uniref:DUF4350 domain-containing protein n=1 Tax=Georgenia alba TaxID=2233858 RepID=A0ABW2QFF4_9MICO